MTSCRVFGSLTSDTEPSRIQNGKQEHMSRRFLRVGNGYIHDEIQGVRRSRCEGSRSDCYVRDVLVSKPGTNNNVLE